MPDWVTHLGTTYITAQGIQGLNPRASRLVDMRYILLGALLPDATRFAVILVDILDWPAVSTFTYLIPFHSLLITILIAGAIAALLPTRKGSSSRAFWLILMGAAFHFLLDDFEGLVGCGSTTFYPFYFGKPVSGWDSEGNFAAMLLVISAMGIGAAFGQRRHWPPLRPCLTRQRILIAAALIVAALIVPLFFRQWMVQQNAYYLGFAANPETFTGHSVELCFSEVIATGPVTVEEFDKPFVLQTPDSFTNGEWVSVRGIYQDGRIHPITLIRHRGFSDVGLSLIAAVAFIFLIIDRRQVQSALTLLKKKT